MKKVRLKCVSYSVMAGCLELGPIVDNELWYAVPVTVTIPGANLYNFDQITEIYAKSILHAGIEVSSPSHCLLYLQHSRIHRQKVTS